MKPQARSLLIELGTEELPPKALDELAAAFAAGIVDGLARRGIAADAAQARSWCTPRRPNTNAPIKARSSSRWRVQRASSTRASRCVRR